MPQKKARMAGSKAHPGLERDAHGKPITMAKRLPEDREKAHRAARNKRAKPS